MNIHQLIEKRQELFDEKDALWDKYYPNENVDFDEAEEKFENDNRVKEIDKESDKLREKVLDFVEEFRDSYSFETIFEALTSTGGAPSLLYDDNGNFAVEGDGIQGVQLDGEKFESFQGTWFTTKDSWKLTVREALNYYLDRLFSEE